MDIHLHPKTSASWVFRSEQAEVETLPPRRNAIGPVLAGRRRDAAWCLAHLIDLRRQLRADYVTPAVCDKAPFPHSRAVRDDLDR